MYQVIDTIIRNPADKTKVKLVFCNVSERDIILKDQLDKWAKDPRVTVSYVLDKAPAGWKGGAGFVNQKMLSTLLPAPAPGNMVYVCGPPGMMASVSGNKKSPSDQGDLTGILADMGFTKEQVFKF